MKEQGYEQLTLFPEDSPVSLSPLPGSAEARRMTVTSGLKCSELYASSGQLGCLVRMCLGSSIWHSTRCYLTWKTKATPLNRLLFRLAVSMPHTNEKGFVFWPTPSTGAALCGGTGNFQTLMLMQQKGMITEEERKNLSQGNGGKTNPELLEWLMGYQKAFTQLIPTPRASDYKGSPLNRFVGGGVLQASTNGASGSHSPWLNWPDEPSVGRVVDGIPNRVDRIRSLGNAVVPQQFYIFFQLISDIEREEKQNDQV